MKVFIGWDVSEKEAWHVADLSLRTHSSIELDVHRIAMEDLEQAGFYTRPTKVELGRRWDILSEAPMSTGHAIARFFIPHLCNYEGWAVFMDGDVLVRRDIAELLNIADPQYAVQVVKHSHEPQGVVKKDGDEQTAYPRKNWSSVMLMNCGHHAHRQLTLEMLNTLTGRDLHRFCWLENSEIGSLPPKWNWLVGHSSESIDPAIVHFTEGLPNISGYERQAYADDWKLFTPSYINLGKK